MTKMQIKAYAKINLVLDVLRKREDGFHEVAMVMQAISLHDDVILEEFHRNWLATDNRFIPANQNNLAMKAVLRMQQEFPELPPVRVTLKKQIPVAAGLAGGSADCAAVLAGMNQMFRLGMSQEKLEQMAAELGSDIPFCLAGPTALATGRGEILQSLPECPPIYSVLVKPPFGVSTPKVYGNLRVTEIDDHPDVERCLQGLQRGDSETILNSLGNVLERSTFELQPRVKALKEDMISLGAAHVLMSGSGPTVFALFRERQEAEAYYKKVKRKYSQAIFAQTVDTDTLNERMEQQ